MMSSPSTPWWQSTDDYEELAIVDRRTHPRIAVAMRVVQLDSEVLYYQHATNLSEGGMFLEGAVPPPEGRQLVLLFVPPGTSTQIVVRAEVVGRLEEPIAGSCVAFLEDEDSPARTCLRDYIHGLLS